MEFTPFSRQKFPPGFIFGVGTSNYQVEGATSEDGREDGIWDTFASIPGNISDGSNADVSADQYHKYQEDVDLMYKLGFEAYRFSISWPRIFPDGVGTEPNAKGIDYYRKLLKALTDKGMKANVTLYHWDLPDYLQTKGGWLCPEIVDHFANFADTCFENFGDMVKYWITFNEPLNTAVKGYGTGTNAPGENDDPLIDPYVVGHHMILAHAKVVSIYNEKYKGCQRGQLGMAPNCVWAEPFSNELKDSVAAKRNLSFQLGWFFDPILKGDYPKVMREKLQDRLPTFSDADKELLTKYPVDFLGLNHYTSRYVSNDESSTDGNFFIRDQQIKLHTENSEGKVIGDKAASDWLYIVPWGFEKLLKYIRDSYDNPPPIYVIENGMDENNSHREAHGWLDWKRVKYYRDYLAALVNAMKDGVVVKGYFAWSYIDNWEWTQGYTKRFGLVYLDHDDLSRHPKFSALLFRFFFETDNVDMYISRVVDRIEKAKTSGVYTDLSVWDDIVKDFMD